MERYGKLLTTIFLKIIDQLNGEFLGYCEFITFKIKPLFWATIGIIWPTFIPKSGHTV